MNQSVYGIPIEQIPNEQYYPTLTALRRVDRMRECPCFADMSVPSLREYLTAAEVLNMDLSRDINYEYAVRTHSPQEIESRISDVFARFLGASIDFPLAVKVLESRLMRLFGEHRCYVQESIYGLEGCNLCDYAQTLRWLQFKEHEYGLDDPLDFEE